MAAFPTITRYIASIWCNTEKKIPTELKPDECGWIKEDSNYIFKWFDGSQWPAKIEDIIINEIAKEKGTE